MTILFIAINNLGERIEANAASKEQEYFCPSCGNPVILKSGKVKVVHFAHEAHKCIDKWNYDMSEWHIKMQNYFPVDNREIVVKHNDIVHRADILIDNTVIEMQHSPISAKEFNDRNEFFRQLGYGVVWIFDVREKINSNQIQPGIIETMFRWKYPLRIFDTLNIPFSDYYYNNFAIYFNLYDDKDDQVADISRIVWTSKRSVFSQEAFAENKKFEEVFVEKIDFSTFRIGTEKIYMNCIIQNACELLLPTKKQQEERVRKRIRDLKMELQEKGFSYSVKYIGVSGKEQEAYICERTNRSISRYSATSSNCTCCIYCAFQVTENQSGNEAYYCCYPYEYRKPKEFPSTLECYHPITELRY